MKNLTTKNEADEAINKNGDKHAKSIKTFFERENERKSERKKAGKPPEPVDHIIVFSTAEKKL